MKLISNKGLVINYGEGGGRCVCGGGGGGVEHGSLTF